MTIVVNDIKQDQAEKEQKADIYEQALAELGSNKFSPAKGIDRDVAKQADDAARSADRYAIRYKIQTQQAAADARKQKNDSQMRPAGQHLDQFAEQQQSI